MQEWLRLFYQKIEGTTLTINGTIYKLTDCKRIGGGSEKHVYQLKDDALCFFIPHKYRSEEHWNQKIQFEKLILDEISQLGLKTQQFELVSIEIRVPGEQPRAINGLLTKDFKSLCNDESIVIHDSKGSQRVTGTPPDFHSMRGRFKDKEFVQHMFKKIIKEYAVAYTFSLPINILQTNDDSQHIIFELPQNSNEPPVVRYMFWDVVSDVATFPFIFRAPTLNELKEGPGKHRWGKKGIAALYHLANTVACTILEMYNHEIDDSFSFVGELQSDILLAIDDDVFLNDALEHAQSLAVPFFNKLFVEFKKEEVILDTGMFHSLMLMAISSSNLDIIEQCYQLRPQNSLLPEEHIDSMLDVSIKYGNQAVVEFLNSKLGAEKNTYEKAKQLAIEEQEKKVKREQLKETFLKQYNKQLVSDKSLYCGIYSFFVKSYVTNDMDLSEIVKHAQGLSKEGTGMRSKLVMKQLGWLDVNNNVTGELSSVIAKI
ncbi:Uncharacterised protein [Legionella quateirensis]|uniref:Uncharacterized protein n=2 Tax=Legionella quateirensis TaxID=45072 RepID=A0A378KTV2_9GAMM|nr:hypothetical protein Lqua_0979 [Legionella quateirensis]STY18003.1 Uncharacterised protein [Legionella quateirensis]